MTPSFSRVLAAAALLALTLPANAATPKPAAKPAPAAAASPARAPAYLVKGFRSARFGQNQDAVIASIQKDLGAKPGQIQHLNVPSDGTTVLTVTVPQMVPGPGPMTATYIFGKTGTLIHVNVVWLLDTPDAAQRSQVVDAGLQLSNYFQTFSWNSGKSARNIPVGPNSVTMFLGRDNAGGVVEVSAAGVSYNHVENGKTVASPMPMGPARLRLAYGSPNEANGVTTIKPGQF